jgi:hypothetical protein
MQDTKTCSSDGGSFEEMPVNQGEHLFFLCVSVVKNLA